MGINTIQSSQNLHNYEVIWHGCFSLVICLSMKNFTGGTRPLGLSSFKCLHIKTDGVQV